MSIKMPFGKHKGQQIGAIPDDYLLWLVDTVTMGPQLEAAVLQELARRGYGDAQEDRYTASPQRALPAAVSPDIAAEIVAAGRRQLASKYHPDRPGGDADRMTGVNATGDFLEKCLSRIFEGVRS